MTRVRHLLIGLASGSAFYSGLAPALGLGEITLHSALNQPLNAEIELLAVGDDMSTSDVKVSLAPADAFNLAGVDRVYFLNDLRFSPILRGGKSIVRVVSNQPVREPYLNFIVELKRPGGQLLREYTLLLDPPTSSSYSSQAAPVGNEQFTSYAPPRRTPIASRGERYQVASGDSLWTIASKLRVEGNQSSLQDLMLDIHALNPDAFSNGDIHRLRAGASLLLPDHARMPEAAPSQPAAAGTAPPAQAPAEIIPNTAPQQPAEPQVEMIAQIRRVEEEVANRSAENLQLQQDLLVVQNQLKDMMTRMEARDQQIAQLLEQLAQRPAPAEAVAPVADSAPPAAAQQSAVAPVTDAQPAAQGFWNLWNVLLASLLAVLALLLLLFKRKRKPAPDAAVEPVIVVPPVVRAPVSEPVEPVVAPRAVVDVPLPVRPPVVAKPESNPTDPLDGANIYIAYGRFGEAISVLRQASAANPQRLDIRFRLLEVLAQQGNTVAFAEEEAALRQAGFDGTRIDALKGRYPALFTLAPEMMQPVESLEPLEGLDELILELDELPPAAPQQAKNQDDDFQLNLDDLSLDADWDLVNPFENNARKKRAGVEPDEPLAPVDEQSTDIFGHDVNSPFAGTMLVEEEGADDDWLELDDLPTDPSDGVDRFVTNHENLTKLNLAMAYIEQDDLEAACDILNEVINEGDEEEKQEARELLARIA
ncbi:FimV/HubP family polar landmark protein [Phytopseudomonas seleniipraecipitans]|uniref:Pilus assembly protein FimV n=1 Tax=Phytopseudomonas seleniipraecipitans TaxID=640205 RepID=A0A1G7V275_9GAMM|nr:FimV/HubP family polar landmark protein [Pseudomonas seleniipraecipitans]SDG53817.1 pilus assembly protein FimV [Pseudomonas seleniipraecipitans]